MKIVFDKTEIAAVAGLIVSCVPNKVLCFHGEMGAGKTTLIKEMVKIIGGIDNANSPTFGLVNEYHDHSENILAYHFDFYRIKNEVEALDFGLEDYFASDAQLFIEWPEKIATLLPLEAKNITLSFIDEMTRSVEFSLD